jgi:hypothetical protein
MRGRTGVGSLNYGNPVNWAAPLNRGLRYWWRVLPLQTGGNSWRDLCYEQSATMAGMLPTTNVKGFGLLPRPGGAGELRFNGSTSSVSTGLTSVNFGWTDTTKAVSVWVRALGTAPTGAQGGYEGAYVVGDSGETYGLSRMNLSGGGDFWYAHAWDGAEIQVGTACTIGAWTQLWYVLTGGNVRLYKDGVLKGTIACGTVPGGTNLMYFGSNGGGARWFNGAIDDVRVYDRAPSASEIAALYTASKQGYPQELNWQVWPPAWARTPPGRVTKNTRSFMLGMVHGMQRGLGSGRPPLH